MKLQPVCYTILLFITICEPFDYNLIKHFQEFKNIQTLLILTCETTSKSITFLNNYVQNYSSWMNILDISKKQDISKVNFEHFFMRLSNAHIVVCSLNCNQSISFLMKFRN